jgi:phosphoribosyl-AMP cyclohydrolase / phosphoribosyl-ATP pyrophosphohydrolase
MAWLNERRPAFDGDHGLLPVVVQDAGDGSLLMLAWANRQAVEATERSGEAHFWSRSRDELWRKGATSGNLLRVVDLAVDCDGDAIRYRVRPAGPACHTGERSCFPDAPDAWSLAALERVIGERRAAQAQDSYTVRLLAGGPRRAAEKVVEEAGELAGAALAGSPDEVRAEAADLLYHVLVLLAARDVTLAEVLEQLADRHRTGG